MEPNQAKLPAPNRDELETTYQAAFSTKRHRQVLIDAFSDGSVKICVRENAATTETAEWKVKATIYLHINELALLSMYTPLILAAKEMKRVIKDSKA